MTRGTSPGAAWILVATVSVMLAAWLAGCSFERSALDNRACSEEEPCDAGQVCNEGYCVAGSVAEPCDGLCGDLESCDEVKNVCLCVGANANPDAEGESCEEGQLCCASGCLDIQSDVANCGGCGVTCGEGESCSGGFCVCGDTNAQGTTACAAPQVCCNDTCTNPAFDASCCGDAREACMGRACIGGACKCAPGTDDCDPDATLACATNTLDSPVHCGMCNTDPDPANNPLCAAGQECFGGQCSCDGSLCEVGEECCNGTLCLSESDTMTDARNCGGCGQVCPPNHVCTGGTCTCDGAAECADDETCCGSPGSRTCVPKDECLCDGVACLDECCPGNPETCVDLAADTLNCGTCGNACGTGQSCVDGVCSCDDENLVNCDGACVDRRTDTDNCGTCGTSCAGGEECCGGACVDTGDDNIAHCGGCGAFCNGDACEGGECVCDGQPVDLTSDVDNCGTCATSCQRAHVTGEACTDGKCDFATFMCESGWGDCENDIATDGCETFLLDNESHCGGCGDACPAGQSCANGACLEVDVVVEIEVGQNFSCARRASGTVECWGKDDKGQLGNGMGGDSQVPEAIGGLFAVDIATGANHACAATADGAVRCWGDNGQGEIGQAPNPTQVPTVVPVPGLASRVAAGPDHSCAIVDRSADGGAVGEVWCWGKGNEGRLGNDSTSSSSTPVQAVGLTGAVDLDAGEKHTCALKGDGSVWCWGEDDNGRLGDDLSANNNRETPTPVALPAMMPPQFARLAVGFKSSFAVTTANALWGWGFNEELILLGGGDEPADEIASGFVDVDAGRKTACGITPAGGLQCWGLNDLGQTGTGSGDDPVTTPTDVVGLQSGVVDVSVGWDHACAVLDAGGVVCWGKDTDGILGNGSDGDSPTPVPVVGLP